MMRVAFDPSSTRGRKTGIGVYTDQLIRALHTFAPRVETVNLEDGATVEQRTDKRILREQFGLARLAVNAHADLLHLTGFAAPLQSRVPVVLTVMDLIGVLFSKNFPPASRFYWSRYLPLTLRSARHIITLSEHTKRDVVRLAKVPGERITVIPPGLDERFHVIGESAALASARDRLRLPERFFFFVSTLEPRKGIDTLINAYARIANQVPEDLVIAGKRGWYYEMLFDQVRALGLDSRIRFTDYISDDDLPFAYNLATAFVFPSRYEGFGLTPLEAMGCGTPVITSNASSLPEIIADAGRLIAPDDVEGFADAMREIALSDSLQSDLRSRALERAAHFSWQRAALATAACYERVGK